MIDDNPFRPDGDLCREADEILKNSTIYRDKVIISDPNSRINSLNRHSASNEVVNELITPEKTEQSMKEPVDHNVNIVKQDNGEGPVIVEVTSKILTTKEDPIQVEHVNIPGSKGKGCCEIM